MSISNQSKCSEGFAHLQLGRPDAFSHLLSRLLNKKKYQREPALHGGAGFHRGPLLCTYPFIPPVYIQYILIFLLSALPVIFSASCPRSERAAPSEGERTSRGVKYEDVYPGLQMLFLPKSSAKPGLAAGLSSSSDKGPAVRMCSYVSLFDFCGLLLGPSV